MPLNLTKHVLLKSLKRLGDLLKESGKKIELVVAGGVISLLVFNSRQLTHDVDAIFNGSTKDKEMLKMLISKVGKEFSLSEDWINDSVSFFGLSTKSNVVVFNHSHLKLVAAKWEELLSHKILAFRSDTDFDDSKNILKRLKGYKKDELYKELLKYKPISPSLQETKFKKRFDQLWDTVFPGK